MMAAFEWISQPFIRLAGEHDYMELRQEGTMWTVIVLRKYKYHNYYCVFSPRVFVSFSKMATLLPERN